MPGPYTTEIMAAETAAVIEALGQVPAHVVGWSDGAYVAAHLALHRPELLPRGQFAVVPGTGHAAPMQKPGLVNSMILDFLSGQGADPPERMVPLGALHDVPAA